MSHDDIKEYQYHYFTLMSAVLRLTKLVASGKGHTMDMYRIMHRLQSLLVLVDNDPFFFESRVFQLEMQVVMDQIGFSRSPYRSATPSVSHVPPKMRVKPLNSIVYQDPWWSSPVSSAVFDDHITTGIEKVDE